MDEYESLSHSKWECKYHVVFIPKCRRKVLYGSLRKHLGEVFRKLAEQKECRIEEGHLLRRPCAHDDLDSAEVCGVARWSVLSRARARSTWRGCMESESRIMRGRVSGRGGILCRR